MQSSLVLHTNWFICKTKIKCSDWSIDKSLTGIEGKSRRCLWTVGTQSMLWEARNFFDITYPDPPSGAISNWSHFCFGNQHVYSCEQRQWWNLLLFPWLQYLTSVLQYLTHLYSLSVNHCNIPEIWKHAIIIPVPKSGKLADLGSSYASFPSFSLLLRSWNVFCKLNSLLLSPNQHGFRPNHSTISALLPLAHKVA